MQKILPTWSVPNNIHAFTTTRVGGTSVAPFDSLNLGDHVQDEIRAVLRNRQILCEQGQLPHFPLFLTQTHSTKIIRLPYFAEKVEADAVYTNQTNQVCLVMTADCLPVLFCSNDGKEIAAAHAGWRGLCDGILENTLAEFKCDPQNIQVWLGPAISCQAFQVGKEVIEQFCQIDPNAKDAFIPDPKADGKFLSNLYLLATQRLQKCGIHQIFGGDYCTYTDKERFFSYRRDGKTGRMATLIWRSE